MTNIPSFVWPLLGILINLLWTALNMRTLSGIKEEIRKEFQTRGECRLTVEMQDQRVRDLERRVDSLENVLPRRATHEAV